MSAVDRSPTVLSGGVAVVAALVAFSLAARSGPGLAVGAVGLAALLAGLLRKSRPTVTLGGAALLLGAVAAGLAGAPPSVALAAVTATVVAWDAAGTAIVLGDQLGRAADTARVEAVHLGATALVGALAASVGYALYRAATGGQPIVALLCFLLAAMLLASADG